MREMKDSGVEWHDTRIKYICDFNPIIKKKLLPSEIVSYTPMECVKNGFLIHREITFENTNSGLTCFEDGDIIMAKVTPCFENGNIAVANNLKNGVAFGSSELFVFRPLCVDTRWLLYYLQNAEFVETAKSTMTGTGGLKRISSVFVRDYPVRLPTQNQQKHISGFLDKKANQIDALITNVQTQIEKLKQYKQSLITEVVTKGLDPTVPMKDSGVEWIGEIPAHWNISRIGRHSTVTLGKMLCSTQLTPEYSLEPYYCAANIHFDGIDFTTQKYMWFNKTEKKQYLVHTGDLLVVEGGAGAGGCAIASVEDGVSTYIQNSIMILRQDDSYDVRYFRYLLESLVKRGYIDLVCNKATIPHFTKDKLSFAPYPIVPKDEQNAIAVFLDSKCAQIDRLISIKQAKIEKLNAYKKSLIYEYVTGKKEAI